jgi:purine-binding chemotaxis protein CheW
VNDKITWLIFSVNTSKYALPSSSIREIVTDEKVFPLPFVPDFVSGLINLHGEPYTVIDPAVIFGEKAQETTLYLILNDTDQNCLRITDIYEFVNISKDEMATFNGLIENSLFMGSLKINGEEVSVLDSVAFIEKTRIDLENS